MRHTLYFNRMNANQVFDFLTKAESALFNCSWQMSMPFKESQTHNVYCELRVNDLAAARKTLAQIAATYTPAIEWQLLPDKI